MKSTAPSGQTPEAVEGITYFDHPTNPGYPSRWHVREDGWMVAAVCLERPRRVTRDQPLVLRYLLHAHGGPIDARRADGIAAGFAGSRAFEVVKASVKHQQFTIARKTSAAAGQ